VPEGDTIWRTAAALRRRLAGRVVLRARPVALAALEGRRVEAVEATGKHLLVRFSAPPGERAPVLHSHMRMTGSWHLYAPGESWRKPVHRARAVLEVEDAVAVCFNAPVVELVREDGAALGHLGPDILAPDVDLDAVVGRARDDPDRPLGELLLDQRVCAGIGNIYKCDSLWQLRLDPWSAVGALDEAELRRLYTTVRGLMLASRDHRGLGPVRRPRVHARAHRPCPRCGTPVEVRPQGAHGRLTYFCPGCQRPGGTPGPSG
jgi:endonuclease VIII